MDRTWACVDGNEAAARVAHAVSEVVAIYPITPASPMGEHADAWTAAGRKNLWGAVPEVVEMQSEAGAAGTLHGTVTKGALGVTFTASQGLLLMLPNMYKIAGELTPSVIHVAARAIAAHALSIFGDHSDVMAARTTGWAILGSSSVQEAQDMALIAHAATLKSRIPFIHFFDGFRTSHEVNKIELVDESVMRAMIDEDEVLAHRMRGLSPDRPQLRGSAQNPDVFFQAREAANSFYEAVPGAVREVMGSFAELTGRHYDLVEYHGAPDADRVVVLMGSGVGAARESVDELNRRGEKVGLINVRLYRPFPAAELVAALPDSVRAVAVLDRVKEPGAPAEPLMLDVTTALAESGRSVPTVIAGRYGLSSKEFTPNMVKGVFDELAGTDPKRRFTVGIVDDVTHLSLPADKEFTIPTDGVSAVFYGLGSDGTVGANKNSVKIIGEGTDDYAQGYFVYDSRKAGSVTTSHLRFGADRIDSTYLVQAADFVAVHQFGLLEKMKVLELAKPGATFLLNAPYSADEVWEHIPVEVQQQIIDKQLRFYVVDGFAVAKEVGLGSRINTVMQPCFFHLSGVLPSDEAIVRIKDSIQKAYGKRGQEIIDRNYAAVDRALEALSEVKVPTSVAGDLRMAPPVPAAAPDFVQNVTGKMIAGEGNLLPVSALPVDGTWPTATSQWEKRAIAQEIPVWDPSICTDCGKCALVCPHAAIRIKVFPDAQRDGAPEGFQSKKFASRALPDHQLTVQVAPDDCTGCGVCVDVCPAVSKTDPGHKSITMEPVAEHRDTERPNFDFFLTIPEIDRTTVRHDTVKGLSQLQPLFEFSGACSGCGETPYIKALTQMFGDRLLIANATGCSSIYGGNLPTTPYTVNADGRGPTWSNSLFEDNAEFGLGLRLAWEHAHDEALRYLGRLRDTVGPELADAILSADMSTEEGIIAQRARVDELKQVLAGLGQDDSGDVRQLASLADDLVAKSVWIVGGDGWAYDIGYGGLDHVLGSGQNVNILVLDTEVYSNTGGQASKATPRGAAAKFAASGKSGPKKDLGMIAQAYGNVYVAQIAIGANEQQTVRALLEAQAWDGPSIVIAYSTCIEHGIDMATSMTHQKDAVASGYWPLYRFRPDTGPDAQPFKLDSKAPTKSVAEFMLSETRFSQLARSNPERSKQLLEIATVDAREKYRYYSQVADMARSLPDAEEGAATTES
jgi:pyruvate-ferredoxin/flavodoxin oxidoreductase